MRRRPPLGVALFCALAIASLATAAAVVHFKTANLALEVQRLSCRLTPGTPPSQVARIRFYVRYSDPHATVSIVGEGLSPARTLASDVALRANRPVSFEWDGRTDQGDPAPPGRYALRVNLPDRDRNMLWIAKHIHLRGPCPEPS